MNEFRRKPAASKKNSKTTQPGLARTKQQAPPPQPALNTFPIADTQKEPTDLQREADRLLLATYVPAAVIVNEHLDILQTRGPAERYLELSPGKASLNLLRIVRPGLLFALQKTMEAARKANTSLLREIVPVDSNGNLRQVSIEITPMKVSARQNFLIVFHEQEAVTSTTKCGGHPGSVTATKKINQRMKQNEQLRQELACTREYLQSIIKEHEATNEELQSANEEIQSSNEELQSTNEELQTSKEELESANQELNTVNDEMQHRNQQLSQLNNDLTNLLNSVNLPIVMLDSDLSVRRITLQAEELLGLSAADVTRHLADVKMKISIPNLQQSVLDVIRTMTPKQQEFSAQNGEWYSLRITPYRTSDNKIEGAVLVLFEGTGASEERASSARKSIASRR
jgi:two-component system, chemotaxis family, CheB/CheR fusion protein